MFRHFFFCVLVMMNRTFLDGESESPVINRYFPPNIENHKPRLVRSDEGMIVSLWIEIGRFGQMD